MRSIIYHELLDHLTITDEKFHHLKNVIRIKLNEAILVMNGQGSIRNYSVSEINKKNIILSSINKIQQEKRKHSIDIAIGKCKKDALDDIIKSCVEMGINKLFILDTEYSQKYNLKIERISKLIESSMEQSNNPYTLQIIETTLLDIPFSEYEIFVMSLSHNSTVESKTDYKKLLVLGPEGGLSSTEEDHLMKLENISFINLPTPILRAKTAVNVAVGHILSSL